MINAHCITFQRLMSAGYISAETYHYLLPKEQLCELSISEIDGYKPQYKSELLPLFKDENTYLAVAYMEKLNSQLQEGDNTPYTILIDCLCEYPVEIEHIVNNIGKKEFLQEYIYCTEEALKKRLLISYENIIMVISFRNKFRSLYQLSCSGLEINEWKSHITDSASSGPTGTLGESSIASGKGFNSIDYITIDDDAVSLSNVDCKKYVLFLYSLNKVQLDTVVDFLISHLKTTSIRTQNSIKYSGYRNFLINYLFADSRKLLNLRNFGRKTLFEFEAIKPTIVDYVKDLYINGNIESIEDSIKKEMEVNKFKNCTLKERIGESQYKVVANMLAKSLKDVSVRCRNSIQAYNGDFIEDYVNKNKDIKSINNIGKKSESEIAHIIRNLRDYIATLKGRKLSEEEIKIIDKQEYYEGCFDKFAHDFYLKNGHLPMFYLLESFLKKALINDRNLQIYNLRAPIFIGEEELILDDIADKFHLTRERVRQIYMKVRKNFYETNDSNNCDKELSFRSFIVDNKDWNYVINDFQINNYIGLSMVTGYCAEENHHFTDDFILFLVGALCRESFSGIGKSILPYPTISATEWNNCYLINRKLSDRFDFKRFFELIEEYEASNSDDIVLSAREMVIDTFVSAWIIYDSNVVDEISDVVSNILIQEFDIIPDEQFRFTIEGKKEEKITDIIYDILTANGNPMSYDKLFQSIDSIYPNRYKSVTSIKRAIGHDSRLCLVGSNSLVALIEWEHVKIGSIRNIIVQFLDQFDEPQQAKDIVSYVQQYRDTSDNSIRATMGSGDQFVQFSGGYYGLRWKQYSKVFSLDENARLFYKHIRELEQSLQTHNLTRKKEHRHWLNNCRQYYEFIQEHHRRPSKSIPNEKELCMWLQKASEDFSNGTLTYQQESCYLDLCKTL